MRAKVTNICNCTMHIFFFLLQILAFSCQKKMNVCRLCNEICCVVCDGFLFFFPHHSTIFSFSQFSKRLFRYRSRFFFIKKMFIHAHMNVMEPIGQACSVLFDAEHIFLTQIICYKLKCISREKNLFLAKNAAHSISLRRKATLSHSSCTLALSISPT